MIAVVLISRSSGVTITWIVCKRTWAGFPYRRPSPTLMVKACRTGYVPVQTIVISPAAPALRGPSAPKTPSLIVLTFLPSIVSLTPGTW